MSAADRGTLDRWIIAQRPRRHAVDPWRPYDFLLEDERAESGEIVPVATVFVTNRECPWRCLFCDLWRNTLTESVPAGAIPAQIDHALRRLPRARHIKVYNSGSFFDHGAIPRGDYEAIAHRLRGFERVIVESHPALINQDAVELRDMLSGRLEVAMGLETAHPEVLGRLNKRMTLDMFAHAAEKLRDHHIALRAFILVKPPFVDEAGALHWARRSIDFAFDCGATVVSLIPTRAGNGAIDQLASRGEFAPPRLAILEATLDYGISLRRGRAFADLWDLDRLSDCPHCFDSRTTRLREMNLQQIVCPQTECERCDSIL